MKDHKYILTEEERQIIVAAIEFKKYELDVESDMREKYSKLVAYLESKAPADDGYA